MEGFRVYLTRVFDECILITINSLFIVSFISTFIGAVTLLQTAENVSTSFTPAYVVATIVRDMTILELAPTLTAVIFAGKIGSSIAGNLGTMKITEQIDALDTMGINSVSYLVLPKVIASVFTFPMIVVICMFLSISGGYIAGVSSGVITTEEYVKGLRFELNDASIVLALVKGLIFPLLIVLVSSYQGFMTRGGALEVGRSSTVAVTKCCVAIVTADLALAQLFVS